MRESHHSPCARAQHTAVTLKQYRRESKKKKTPDALQQVIALLNEAGIGRYQAHSSFGELVPNATCELGRTGIQLREAIAQLTFEPGDKTLYKTFLVAIKEFKEARKEHAPCQ